jgi:hypothetical protein
MNDQWREFWGQATDGLDYETWLEQGALAMHKALLAWRRAWAEQGERKVHLMVVASTLTEQALALFPPEEPPCRPPTTCPPAETH